MTADVAENSAVFFPLEEPSRTGGQSDSVGTRADHVHCLADESRLQQISRQNGAFALQTLGIEDKILPSGFRADFFRFMKLFQSGEGRLVHKIIPSVAHDVASERSSFIGNPGRRHQPDSVILVDPTDIVHDDCTVLCRQSLRLFSVPVIHIQQGGSRFDEG